MRRPDHRVVLDTTESACAVVAAVHEAKPQFRPRAKSHRREAPASPPIRSCGPDLTPLPAVRSHLLRSRSRSRYCDPHGVVVMVVRC